jgi:hypothetical protein
MVRVRFDAEIIPGPEFTIQNFGRKRIQQQFLDCSL